ncbi:cyclin-B2-2-like [Eucalyptus grandis]|uniref:cyclin-B2-2-like n=1 Tax=Eucalyptus grandis TaxID=71139 RepID=UPI00192E9FE6|nr:cyclin-B2-2-like [Eucalyptus grandis]
MQEYLMLKTLGYDLSISTPSIFMWKFLDETLSDDKIKNLSSFFIDLCLVWYETCTFRPSILTAAAIYTAHATVRRRKPCSKIYEQLTGCSVGQIWKCSRLMVTSHIKARSVESVYKKYNTSRYNWVARARPARFLLTKFSKAMFITFKLILFLLKDT